MASMPGIHQTIHHITIYFLIYNFFTDNPLHTDTAKASMDNPIPISNISILDIFIPQQEYNLPLQPHNAYWMQSVH